MTDHRAERRGDRRAFRPTLTGSLESRVLMATSAIHAHTAAGGQAVLITNTSGIQFYVSVINGGTIRATAASGGRVNLIADGTTTATLLEISRVVPKQLQGTAHTFNSTRSTSNKLLNIASITTNTGMINSIEGYQTAVLSGPITLSGAAPVNRIAFDSILPGGSILTGGDLNTLDVYSDVNLSGGNINVGRDLNWFETFGNVTVSNGASFTVARDVGTTLQPIKGSGNAGQGIYIGGNLTVSPGGNLIVGRNIPAPAGVVINGTLAYDNNITIGGNSLIYFLEVVKSPANGQVPNFQVGSV